MQSASLDAGIHAYYSSQWTLGSQEVKYKDECSGPRPSAPFLSYCVTIMWQLKLKCLAWLFKKGQASAVMHCMRAGACMT